MKKISALFVLFLIYTGCGSSQTGLPDPNGTNTSNLQKEGQGENGINFETASTERGVVNTFTELSVDSGGNFVATVGIKDLGFVSGLGGITTRDPSNSVTSAPAVAGHAYLASTVSGLLVGIYVTGDIPDGNGGVTGKAIKWNVFTPASDSNNPFTGLWRGPVTLSIQTSSGTTSTSGQLALYIVQSGTTFTGKAFLFVPAGGGGTCGDTLTGSSDITGTVSNGTLNITVTNSPIFKCGQTPLAITGSGSINNNILSSGTFNITGEGGIVISAPLALTRQ